MNAGLNRLSGRLHAARRTGAGDGGEGGSASVFLLITLTGLLLIVGLVADGGLKLRATQRADAVAAEAARAGGQSIDLPTAVSSAAVRVDRQRAANAANAYLATTGHTGTVGIADDGTTLTVSVTITSPTAFLNLIGVSSMTVTGHGQATLIHAVNEGGP